MKLRNIIFVIFTGSLNLTSYASSATDFSDSFESGDMSTTNVDGFSWGKNNKTSIVTQHPEDGPVALYNNKSIYRVHSAATSEGRVKDWTAKSGENSLRFRYSAGSPWTEQRYDLGSSYPEIWFSYWIRIPTNYYRELGTNGGKNNKWFNIQMAPMSQYQDKTVSRVEMQEWSNGAGGMKINIQFRNGSNGKYKSSNSYPDFVTPDDAGRWMLLTYHLKASSTTTSTDGILRMYRKWEDETSDTLINELIDINVGIGAGSISSNRKGWAAGYIMGYANDPYKNDTEWLFDSLTISSSRPTPTPPTNLSVTTK